MAHLDAGGGVPIRHLGEGGLSLPGPVIPLTDGVLDTVLGVQVAFDVSSRNACS